MPDRSSNGDWAGLHARHAHEWTNRLAAACRAVGVDGCVIFSGETKFRFRDDREIPFVAEPYFSVWVPETYPDAVLKIVPGERPRLIYLKTTDFWHMPVSDPDGFWTDSVDVRRAGSRNRVLKELGPLSRLAAIGDAASESMGFASVNDPALLAHLDFHRAIKTPYEAACIEEANRIAAAGHLATQGALAHDPSEFQLNQIYCSAVGQRESALPYQNIVALNDHAGILHYQHLDAEPPDRFLTFLLDAGADCNGYASDITRTCTRDAELFDGLIESVDAMQQRICADAVSGTSFAYLHEETHRQLAEILAEHKLVRCTAGEAFDRGITRAFLPHGLGHLLGLQVHDAGGHLHEPGGPAGQPPEEYPFLRLTRTLQPGFVVTVEPGLYFIPSLLDELRHGPCGRLVDWALVDSLLPYGGIRVEDNVLVTEAGSRNLTRSALPTRGQAGTPAVPAEQLPPEPAEQRPVDPSAGSSLRANAV